MSQNRGGVEIPFSETKKYIVQKKLINYNHFQGHFADIKKKEI